MELEQLEGDLRLIQKKVLTQQYNFLFIRKNWKVEVFRLFLFSSSNEDGLIVKVSNAFSLLDENRNENRKR